MAAKLKVLIFSFSYHGSGIPSDPTNHHGGFVFDCRFLPNPGREEKYMQSTGQDPEVIAYFFNHSRVSKFLEHVYAMIDAAVQSYIERDFNHLMVSFGCTGGQHRSVFCAENLAKHLRQNGIAVELEHTELGHLNL